jgi:prepilin-type N-terminal cleavage/methylation domain-containing protein
MRRALGGFTLVEVLVALLLLSVGLLPVIYGVGAGIAAARRGTARSRAALALMTRMAFLQRESGLTTPRCARLVSGRADSLGLDESWSVSGSDSVRTVILRVRIAQPNRPLEDSAVVRIRCA